VLLGIQSQPLSDQYLEVVLDLRVRAIDGVTYTLQPTQRGDVVPDSEALAAIVPSWPSLSMKS
jgi:hypothetical protein